MKNLIIFDLQGTLVKSMRPPILNGSLITLQKLSQISTLALFTGAPKAETINILKKLTIYSLFNPKNIITLGQFPKKPNPKAIFWLTKQNKSAKTIYVGDTRKDNQVSINAGIPFIYIGKQKLGLLQIETFDQLLNVKIIL